MHVEHIWEWLREHQASEAVMEAERLMALEEGERVEDIGGEEGEERDH